MTVSDVMINDADRHGEEEGRKAAAVLTALASEFCRKLR